MIRLHLPSTQVRILALWAGGKTTLEIADELCLNHESVAYNVIAKSAGDTEPHPRASVTVKQREQIRERNRA